MVPPQGLILLVACRVVDRMGRLIFHLDFRPPSALAPAQAVRSWTDRALRYDLAEQCRSGLRPATIFWSGPSFNQYPVRAEWSAAEVPGVIWPDLCSDSSAAATDRLIAR